MKKQFMTAMLVSALAIGGSAFAADATNEIVQPRPIEAGYQTVVKDLTSELATTPMWVASSDTKTYYLALRDVAAIFPNPQVDVYQLTVKEVPTSYYTRDVLIPERQKANLSIAGYENYAYSVTTYRISVQRKTPVEGQVLTRSWVLANSEYKVAKATQKDYTADGKLLGEQNFSEELQVANPGSDYYALATGVDKKIYNYRPAGR